MMEGETGIAPIHQFHRIAVRSLRAGKDILVPPDHFKGNNISEAVKIGHAKQNASSWFFPVEGF